MMITAKRCDQERRLEWERIGMRGYELAFLNSTRWRIRTWR